jgi:hypothetical protein
MRGLSEENGSWNTTCTRRRNGPSQIHLTIGDRIQPQNRLADSGFAATRLTHQRKRLAAIDGERHAIHRVDLRDLLAQHTTMDREVLLQAVDLEQWTLSDHAAAILRSA